MNCSVVGAGSWGTAVAWLLANAGHSVRLWAHTPDTAEFINREHRNPRYLTDVELPSSIACSSDFAYVLEDSQAVFVVTPSYSIRQVAASIAPHLPTSTPIAILSKGVEKDSGLLLSEVLEELLGNPSRIAAISGPNHAEEISKGLPSATVVASTNPDCARFFQSLLMGPNFRVYTSSDVRGVELCAACKNIIAVLNGAACAMGYGDNTSALVMTRGLAEMSRLVVALGGDPLTCQGLAGMGDLVATCTSRHSRNRSLGEAIATGGTLAQFTERTHMVAEGANASITVTDLARKHGVELPLAETLRKILWEGASLDELSASLMQRPPKSELEGLEVQ